MRINLRFKFFMEEVENFFSLVSKILPDIQKKEISSFKKRINSIKKDVKSERMSLVRYFNSINEIHLNIMKVFSHKQLLLNSSFVFLISNLEYLLKEILRELLLIYPEKIEDKKSNITISEIKSLNNIQEVNSLMINKHIRYFMFCEFKEQLKIIFKFLDISEKDLYVDLSLLERAYKTRNLILHNSAMITKDSISYLIEAREKDVNKRYSVPYEILKKIYNEILSLGIILIFFLDLRINDHNFIKENLSYIAVDLLKQKHYNALISIYLSTKSNLQYLEGNDIICNDINYLIALKHLPNRNKDFKRELSKLKFEHFDPLYKAAIYVLKGDKKKFIEICKKTDLTLEDWNEFPLFEDFRKDKKVFAKIKKILIENSQKRNAEQKKIFRKGTTKKKTKIKKINNKKKTENAKR